MDEAHDDLQVRQNVPLAPLCTLRVGGTARYLIEARTIDQARRAARRARDIELPVLALGGGSNLVVGDAGFPGLVLRVLLRGTEFFDHGSDISVRIGAGEAWDEVVAESVRKGLSGIECLSGIPGSAGATPIQNVGAYGQEVGDRILEIAALDLRDGSMARITRDECGFGYRTSRFKTGERRRYLILSVTLGLSREPPREPRNDELLRYLREHGGGPHNPQEIRNAVIELRRRKSMVLEGNDSDVRSVGSFFTNPILQEDDYAAVLKTARASSRLTEQETTPIHALPDGSIKIPAAWLIERAGFPRGFVRGRVGLSPQHALAIINHGNATADEIIALARDIRDAVNERFGVRLKPEPDLIGVSLD